MREKLSDIISDYADFLPWETIDAIADSIIENGFTIPVRCKDCKHWRRYIGVNGDACSFGECDAHDLEAVEDDFCSYGERREGE